MSGRGLVAPGNRPAALRERTATGLPSPRSAPDMPVCAAHAPRMKPLDRASEYMTDPESLRPGPSAAVLAQMEAELLAWLRPCGEALGMLAAALLLESWDEGDVSVAYAGQVGRVMAECPGHRLQGVIDHLCDTRTVRPRGVQIIRTAIHHLCAKVRRLLAAVRMGLAGWRMHGRRIERASGPLVHRDPGDAARLLRASLIKPVPKGHEDDGGHRRSPADDRG